MKKILSLFTLLLIAATTFAADYTDKLSVTNGTSGEYGYSNTLDEATMTATDLGDGTYKMTLDLSGEEYFGENFTFVCNATQNDDGTVSLACNKYEYTLTYGNWAGRIGYTTAEGKIYGDKLYAKVYVDYGGYAERYPEYGYGYTFTFGTNPDVADAVKGVNADNVDTISQVYTISGAKTGSPQTGVNIVRLANGKTLKVLRK